MLLLNLFSVTANGTKIPYIEFMTSAKKEGEKHRQTCRVPIPERFLEMTKTYVEEMQKKNPNVSPSTRIKGSRSSDELSE